MAVRINKKLNLVFPVDTSAGEVYVHSIPISREVFERYYRVIARTMAAVYRDGMSIFTGPRIATLLLRDLATQDGNWDGVDGVQNGLLNEIKRLTNVTVAAASRGWETIPYADACARGIIDEDDSTEVEGILCFFTFASWIHRHEHLAGILASMGQLWGAQTTSSSCTEYAASLPTSTVVVSSGVTAAIAS